MTSTASSLLLGVSSWVQACARHRHLGPCWENRERLSCPLPFLRLQLLVSQQPLLRPLQVCGAGRPGPGRGAVRVSTGGCGRKSYGLSAGAQAKGPRLHSLLCSSAAHFLSGLPRAGTLQAAWAGELPPFPCGYFLGSQEGYGVVPPGAPL